jgi:glucose-1-phosphate thymidylyltransferase
MLAGIREIVIITNPHEQRDFMKLLGDGGDLGIKFHFEVQKTPDGIASAFQISENHIRNKKCALILGDNLFHGSGLGEQLNRFTDLNGAQIFAYQVSDPERYGVVDFDAVGNALSLEEKPEVPKSNFAVPGLYFYDETILDVSSSVGMSERGEREITTVNLNYLLQKNLKVSILPRGTTWLDTGTFATLHDASSYVRLIQERQGNKIGCLEEVAFRQGWISQSKLVELARLCVDPNYSQYLIDIAGSQR